jgi:hypothetical protein
LRSSTFDDVVRRWQPPSADVSCTDTDGPQLDLSRLAASAAELARSGPYDVMRIGFLGAEVRRAGDWLRELVCRDKTGGRVPEGDAPAYACHARTADAMRSTSCYTPYGWVGSRLGIANRVHCAYSHVAGVRPAQAYYLRDPELVAEVLVDRNAVFDKTPKIQRLNKWLGGARGLPPACRTRCTPRRRSLCTAQPEPACFTAGHTGLTCSSLLRRRAVQPDEPRGARSTAGSAVARLPTRGAPGSHLCHVSATARGRTG